MDIFSLKKFLKNINAEKSKGFTLIEMIIAIGIFSVLMGVLSGIFLASMKSQKHIVYTQSLIDNTNYVLDYMSRYLRMAQKDYIGDCVGREKDNFDPSNASSSVITFLDYKEGGGRCHQFLLENGELKERISADQTAANFEEAQSLTSDRVKITNLQFNVAGGANYDEKQPRITILIGAEADTEDLDPLPEINVQTTISQRNLDKEL
ncbi:MAG: prepilin-type N-terminal cleavage/methylation domain-containing protein [Candidatus Paceibacterota bacterium]|jgi:prepilin-type N-terminal cleavage/methylation domain-containing protein